MSNGAIATSQATGSSAVFGSSLLTNQQAAAQQQNDQAGSSFGSDRISNTAPGEAPPLLPSTAPSDAKADSIVGSQVTSYAAVALLGAVIAIFAAGVLPFAMDAGKTRAKMKRDLKIEEFEHTIREAVRKNNEPSVDWVRHLEEIDADPFVVDRTVKYLAQAWDKFAAAHEAVEKADGTPSAELLAERQKALAYVEKLGIPLKKAVVSERLARHIGKHVQIDSANHHMVHGISQDAALAINQLYHSFVVKLKDHDKMDRDNGRLLQMQTEAHIKTLVGLEPNEAEKFKTHGVRSEGRYLEFNKKLISIHEAAVQKLIKLPMGPVR